MSRLKSGEIKLPCSLALAKVSNPAPQYSTVPPCIDLRDAYMHSDPYPSDVLPTPLGQGTTLTPLGEGTGATSVEVNSTEAVTSSVTTPSLVREVYYNTSSGGPTTTPSLSREAYSFPSARGPCPSEHDEGTSVPSESTMRKDMTPMNRTIVSRMGDPGSDVAESNTGVWPDSTKGQGYNIL